MPSLYGVFEGPDIVPVQCNISSSLLGAAEHVGRGSFWRFNHSCWSRLRAILAKAETIAMVMESIILSVPGCLLRFVSFVVLSLNFCGSCLSMTPSSRFLPRGLSYGALPVALNYPSYA